MMTAAQRQLCGLLRVALTGNCADDLLPHTEDEWRQLLAEMQKHKVTPLLFGTLYSSDIPSFVRNALLRSSREAANQSYHLMFTAKYLLERFAQSGIDAVLLKGGSAARYYATPEMRKSGDVDLLLLDKSTLDRCSQILREAGMLRKEEQHAEHHQEWVTQDGISVELHVDLIEAFDNKQANDCILTQLSRMPRPVPEADILGLRLPVLPRAYEAYHLLLHMLQHFVGSGFGVRLLCDWVCFWNTAITDAETKQYLQLVHECGLNGFHRMITSVCVHALGLHGHERGVTIAENLVTSSDGTEFCALMSDTDCEQFLEDILRGGDFGEGETGRMVTLEGRGIWRYVKEFHRQTRRNFPLASRCFLVWPVLWIWTLVRFLRNNRRLARGSAMGILRNATKRGQLHASLKLFTKEES